MHPNLTGHSCDDDCEFVVLLHPKGSSLDPDHIHDGREVVCKKTATSITVEPMLPEPRGAKEKDRVGHDRQWTYVRTTEKNEDGLTIFRPGAPPPVTKEGA